MMAEITIASNETPAHIGSLRGDFGQQRSESDVQSAERAGGIAPTPPEQSIRGRNSAAAQSETADKRQRCTRARLPESATTLGVHLRPILQPEQKFILARSRFRRPAFRSVVTDP